LLLFIDFEASSLNKQSYPIEVGWVLEDGSSEGHLIRPAPGWDDWDASAEAIHGLSRDMLVAEGEPHEAVCARLVAAFEGHTACASAPTWDGHWLSMLLRAAGHPRHLLRLHACEEAFIEAARKRLGSDDSAAIAALVGQARSCVESETVAHRAVADARREWAIWKAISG